MKFIKTFLSLSCFLFTTVFYGQINISELVQPSKIAEPSENSLYFVDFWATWCAPCIHVSKYLTKLQEQYPDNFYVISLTEENPETVKRFLRKHITDLAIAIDYEGETFDKYKIRSLPRGILFNAKGNELWEGHPADFKISHLKRFLNRNRKKVPLDKLFNIQKINTHFEPVESVYIPKLNAEFVEIAYEYREAAEINYTPSYLEIKGTLQDILAYALKVSREQIEVDDNFNKSYHVYFKRDTPSEKNIIEEINAFFNIEYEILKTEGEILVLSLENANFWDKQQINWGFNGDKYLVDDSQIQADNVSFENVKYKLASILKKPIVSKGNYDNEKHDWQIHYKFFELMKSDLAENFGIIIDKKIAEYPIYNIIKKTP